MASARATARRVRGSAIGASAPSEIGGRHDARPATAVPELERDHDPEGGGAVRAVAPLWVGVTISRTMSRVAEISLVLLHRDYDSLRG